MITTDLHTGWRLSAATDTAPERLRSALAESIPAQVPGCVHTDLLAAGLIDDPYLDDNEAAQRWIGLTDWTYRTTLVRPAGDHARHELVFDGLDTVATVRVNGGMVHESANQHRSYRIDVTDVLTGGEDELEVAFASPVRYANAQSLVYGARPRPYPLPYEAIRKSACSFGWDWGIHTATSGIWRPVRLESWSGVRLGELRLVAEPDGGGGRVRAEVQLAWAGRSGAAEITLEVAGARSQVVVPPNTNSAVLDLTLQEVQRWWPVGYGDQVLYDAQVSVSTDGRTRDVARRRVGFRTVRWDTTPDVAGTPLALHVNGRAVYVKGVNWIPDDAFPTRVDAPRYERRLRQAVAANVNLVRVWGGGIYEDDAFYEICDELGLLTWQDFLFACAAYPEEEPLRGEVEAEARDNIARLAHHASLVMLCGNNENLLGVQDWGWQLGLDGKTWGAAYYHELLPALVADLAPHVPYSPGSPFSPGGEHPNDERHGSVHLWEQWNLKDWRTYAEHMPRLVAEFGWQGPPAWATLRRSVSDDPLTPESPGMIVHQKADSGNAKLTDGLVRHLRVPQQMPDWHWAMQLNQALAVRFALDHFRALAPHNSGAIVWQLNDCWPVTSWSAVDGEGRRKPLWYALRAAFAPRVVTIHERGQRLVAVVSNDTDEEWTGSLTLSRRPIVGEVPYEEQVIPRLRVPARESQHIEIPAVVAAPGSAANELLVAGIGQVRGYWWFTEPRESELPAARLRVSTSRLAPDAAVVRVTARSTVRTLTLLADVADPSAQTEQGMVTLLPGEQTEFTVQHAVGIDPAEFATNRVLRSMNDLVAAPTVVEADQDQELIQA